MINAQVLCCFLPLLPEVLMDEAAWEILWGDLCVFKWQFEKFSPRGYCKLELCHCIASEE